MFIIEMLSDDEKKQIQSIGVTVEEKEYTYEMLIELNESILEKEVRVLNESGEKFPCAIYSKLSDIFYELVLKEIDNGNKPFLYKRPAIVRFIGDEESTKCYSGHELKHDHYYLAYFVEYWETERDNVNIKNDSGKIDYWYELKDFKIYEDKDGSLELYSAIVRCINPSYSRQNIVDPEYGDICEAVGISRDGYYLVYAGSHNYYYPPEDFEIMEDQHGILDKHKRNWFLYCGLDDVFE